MRENETPRPLMWPQKTWKYSEFPFVQVNYAQLFELPKSAEHFSKAVEQNGPASRAASNLEYEGMKREKCI